jgi:hypothetical protein
MNPCCIESFARKGVRENFRLAEENEGHTCETCGTVYRLKGTWQMEASGPKTVNVFDGKDPEIDFGWGRGTRNPSDHTISVQCWGCGAITVVPDRPFVEMHFDHCDPKCSLERAIVNKSKGVMPKCTSR